MTIGVRVDAVILHEFAALADALEHARNEGDASGLGELFVDADKAVDVRAPVIGWQPYSEEQDAGAGAAGMLDHRLEILPHGFQRLPAQTIIPAEFDDHYVGFVALDGIRKARATATGGIAGDARVDHAMGVVFGFEARAESAHPAVFDRDTVAGADTVAKHENGRPVVAGRQRYGGQQQNKHKDQTHGL